MWLLLQSTKIESLRGFLMEWKHMLFLESGKVSMANYFFLASVKKVFGISFVDIKQCHFPISMQKKFTVASLE